MIPQSRQAIYLTVLYRDTAFVRPPSWGIPSVSSTVGEITAAHQRQYLTCAIPSSASLSGLTLGKNLHQTRLERRLQRQDRVGVGHGLEAFVVVNPQKLAPSGALTKQEISTLSSTQERAHEVPEVRLTIGSFCSRMRLTLRATRLRPRALVQATPALSVKNQRAPPQRQ